MRTARRERLSRPYPMLRVVERVLGPEDKGPVFVWDIDKTYLDTRFSELKHLAAIPFEFGIDKRAISGSVALLQALREGPDGRAHRPLYFVSASPPEISAAIERKMLLDGVQWDGITYKDPLRVLVKGRFNQLRQQVAFKLAALLLLAEEIPEHMGVHLFGDDVEADAVIYSTFAEAAEGKLRGSDLEIALRARGVRPRDAEVLVPMFDVLPKRRLIEGIHIRLERFTDGSTIRPLSPLVHGYTTFGAAAIRLHALGLISGPAKDHIVAESGPGTEYIGANAQGG